MWIIDDASTDPDGLRQAGVPVFLYGVGALAAAEALEVLDVRQDDLTSGSDPLAGKRHRGGTAGEETQ